MKKVLFATTALVATASVAAADVSFSGYGRFGIIYQDTAAGDSTDVTSRLRLQIDATAESDAGVTFGARVRIQQNNTDNTNSPAGTGFNGARFFARSGGFEVGVGNIFGRYHRRSTRLRRLWSMLCTGNQDQSDPDRLGTCQA